MNKDHTKPIAGLAGRGVIGGVLMGLANLVPGISGGTMLLASGIYPNFINAIAELTTFKFRFRSIVLLAAVVCAAAVAILLLAGTVKDLVVDHRWIMYSIFIGLTLGGIPIVWRMTKPATASTWAGAVTGFIVMACLAYFQQTQAGTGSVGSASWLLMFLAGVAGASAMILPGVSGGYLLLVLGVYVPILAQIDRLKEGLKIKDMAEVMDVGMHTVIPVGLGVVIGVALVSNLLRYFLKKHKQATLGFLLGLLVGAVVGLWPFQQGVKPEVGDFVKGQAQTELTLAELDPEDYPTQFFTPTAKHIGGALGLILAGFLTTLIIARIGNAEDESAVV